MEKEITVQELIDQLNQIENKNLPVDCTVGMTSVQRIDEGSVLDVETIDVRTNSHGAKPVAVTLMLSGIPKVECVCFFCICHYRCYRSYYQAVMYGDIINTQQTEMNTSLLYKHCKKLFSSRNFCTFTF